VANVILREPVPIVSRYRGLALRAKRYEFGPLAFRLAYAIVDWAEVRFCSFWRPPDPGWLEKRKTAGKAGTLHGGHDDSLTAYQRNFYGSYDVLASANCAAGAA